MALGQPISTLNIEELGGSGCNYDEDITSLGENESPNSIDVEFDETVVRKRPGYESITSQTNSNDIGYAVADFGAANARKLVSHQGDAVYSMDNLEGTQTVIRAGAPYSPSYFTEVKRNLIHTFENYDVPYYWDSTTTSMQVLSASAPGFKHAVEAQGFLLGGSTVDEPLRIYYEDTNTMLGGTYADFFTLDGGRADELTGYFIHHGRTYATTKTAVFLLSFVGGVTVWEYKKVIHSTGAVPRTAQTMVTDEFGEVVVFLGYDLNLYLFDGSFVRVISEKYRKANNDTPIALEFIDRNKLDNVHATFDAIRRVYRLFITKKGDDTNEFCMNVDVRNLGYYPYQNMTFNASTMAQDKIGRLFLIGLDYNGKVYKMFTEVNDDDGEIIVENYEAPPLSSALEKYKKVQTVDMHFTPVANYRIDMDDRTDFDKTWKSRTQLPMFTNRDRFLGENFVLGETAKLGSEAAIASHHVNIPVTNNVYRFRLHTNGVAGALCRYFDGSVAGLGGGASITGTGTIWTSDMTAANGWKIWINDGEHKNFIYDFTYTSATTATVSTMTGASPADDFTGAEYEIYKTGDPACEKRWELLKIDYNVKAFTSGKGSKIR